MIILIDDNAESHGAQGSYSRWRNWGVEKLGSLPHIPPTCLGCLVPCLKARHSGIWRPAQDLQSASPSPISLLQNLLAYISTLHVLLLYILALSVLWPAFYKQIQQNSQRGMACECLLPVSHSEFTGGSLTVWTLWEGSLNTAWMSLIIPSKYLSPGRSGLSMMCTRGKEHFPSENLDAVKTKWND